MREADNSLSSRSGLFETFCEHVRRSPDRRWLTFETSTGEVGHWTYGEFLEETESTIRQLRGLGLSAADTLLVCLPNHPAIIRLVLAASATGVVPAFADPSLTARELGDLVEVAGAQVILARPDHDAAAEASRTAGARRFLVGAPLERSGAGDQGGSPEPERSEQRPETEPVELLFTSGTTSRPKGVTLTDASLIHGSTAICRGAAYQRADVPLVTLPLYHAAAQIHQLWPTLLLGGRAIVTERFSATRFFGQACRHGATTSGQFAATLRMLLARGSAADARESPLRHITFAQSLREREYAEWEARFGVPLQQLWGLTETSGLPIMSPLEGGRRLTAMGKPVEDYSVALDDERTIEDDRVGELLVRIEPGVNGMLGYHGDAKATAEVVRDGWLHTGDRARLDRDGFFHFLGRERDVIRRAGVNFSSLEVEEALRSLPAVADAAVVALPDRVRDERVAAFVVAADGSLTVAQIQEHCERVLAEYKRPEVVELVSDLPRTAVGKVQKHLLAESSGDSDR